MDLLLKAALIAILSLLVRGPNSLVHLQPQAYTTADTSRYETFRLKVVNPTDTPVSITGIETSCGCFMATVQRAMATQWQPGEIYVALTIDKLSREQPTTIDVFTTATGDRPLRLTIRRKGTTE